MKKTILLLALLIINCQKPQVNNEGMVAVLSLVETTSLRSFNDPCVSQYALLNWRTKSYDFTVYASQNWNTSKTLVIGDSIMDWSRGRGLFTDSETLNLSIYGSNACDFLIQVAKVSPRKFDNFVVGIMDYNGRKQGVSKEVSIATLKRVIETGKEKYNPNKIILIGIHPHMFPDSNIWKNEQNKEMKQYAIDNGYCFIDTVEMMGLGETDMPDPSIFLDNDGVHYNETIYAMVRNKIITQCGVSL